MGSSIKRNARHLLLASAAVMLAAAAPSAGHAAEYDLASYGDWTTSVADGSDGHPFCSMHTDMRDGGEFSVIANTDNVWIRAYNPNWTTSSNQNYSIEAVVDGDSYTGTVNPDGANSVSAPVSVSLIQALIGGEQAVVNVNGDYSWSLDLAGSADAANALLRCVDTLQNS